MMGISPRASLQTLNTFHIPVFAREIISVYSAEELQKEWLQAQRNRQPHLILGEGSNVLFLEHFAGTVILNRISGIERQEDNTHWYLHVGAGEKWHPLVNYCLENNMPGLENLALIPGYSGTAPIQNIGAYGVEFSDVCRYVDFLQFDSGKVERLSSAECHFSYRNSLFKTTYKDRGAVVATGLKLAKAWRPVLRYGELRNWSPNATTPQQVYDFVCQTRQSKLPDPDILGNAGSFFKNPVVSQDRVQQLIKQYPDMPVYPYSETQSKLSAGWLIDRAGLKGFTLGGAHVHQQQALVIVNTGNAQSQDIVQLAKHIRNAVIDRFAVYLEPEVRFIARDGEIDPLEVIV